jgi:sterol desaturase/sphingolipid hydroxylase (fatty acid hydroxylase superfamily)
MLNPGKNLRIFKNDFLEKFTYVHPIVPVLIWGPVAGYCFYLGVQSLDLWHSTAIFVAGLFVWSFLEYFLHKTVFHFTPTTPFQEKVAYFIHGIHHDDPDDQRRLLMPPAASLILAVLFYSIFYLVVGPDYINPFFSGFVLGYLCYDYIHFASHYIKPRGKWMLALKQNHMKHHFVSQDKLYGVSSPIWDYVFKTK